MKLSINNVTTAAIETRYLFSHATSAIFYELRIVKTAGKGRNVGLPPATIDSPRAE